MLEQRKFSVPPISLASIPKEPERFAFCPSPRKVKLVNGKSARGEAASAAVVGGESVPKCQIIEEEMDPNYCPSQEDVEEYAAWLGMDLVRERHLLWLARDGLMEPCPDPWKPCKTEDNNIFYFNFKTGESIWDHPSDVHYKQLYLEHKNQQQRACPVPSLALSQHLPQHPADSASDLPRSPRKVTARAKQTAIATTIVSGNASQSQIKVLQEGIDPEFEPTQSEIEEYAAWLGMDLAADGNLLWIARAGLKEACPDPWKPCQKDDGEIFYFNFKTGESIWDHPCDQSFKDLYYQHKAAAAA